jgi:hypothetical protein
MSALSKACKSAIVLGIRSIMCPHAPSAPGIYFLVWIITYWTKVISLCATHEPWVHAEEALQKQKRGWKKPTKYILFYPTYHSSVIFEVSATKNPSATLPDT